ncbi:hypothetical protein SLEP1_g54816 [Rubroshorea leprosula]|uniref:Uncharacterized protein n=1 Tax=Rubroshorea leprosula TaxID=152421 RepID=A0AAV5MEP3_9ROSI|nr:hypothetical protein SLEP1_g54816 [Rubroshorea leprosula]
MEDSSCRKDVRFEDGEYEIEELGEHIKSSRASRFDLLENVFGIGTDAQRKFSHETLINGIRDLSKSFVIHPDNKFQICSLFLISSITGERRMPIVSRQVFVNWIDLLRQHEGWM